MGERHSTVTFPGARGIGYEHARTDLPHHFVRGRWEDSGAMPQTDLGDV
jgi:hypothetical protein